MTLGSTDVDPDTLQTEVEVVNNAAGGNLSISGTLAYITDFTAFSGDPELQSGNYMALKFATDPADTTVTIQMIGGATVRDPVTLDSDRNAIIRVADKDAQKLKVVVSSKIIGYDDAVYEYDLSNLTLESL